MVVVDALELVSNTCDRRGLPSTRMGLMALGFLVGASISAMVGASVVLNGNTASPYHAVYVSALVHVTAATILSPRAVCEGPLRWPTEWWPLLGGVLAVPQFIIIPVAQRFGVQAVLLTQDAGVLLTALLVDSAKPLTPMRQMCSWGGVLLVLVGAGNDARSAVAARNGGFDALGGFTSTAPLCFMAVFLCGAAITLQAKCNGRLAKDVGSSSRASCICLVLSVVVAIPVLLGVYGAGVQPSIKMSHWPLVLCGGLQALFYLGSLSVIPERIGYGVTYLIVFLGKITISAFIDSFGIAGARVPFTKTRGVSLVFIILGFALYLADREAEASGERAANLGAETKAETPGAHEPSEDQHCLLNPNAGLLVVDTV